MPVRSLTSWSLLLLFGCSEPEAPLRLVVSPEEPAPRIAARLVQLLHQETDLRVEVVSGSGSLSLP